MVTIITKTFWRSHIIRQNKARGDECNLKIKNEGHCNYNKPPMVIIKIYEMVQWNPGTHKG